jgi:hypothetical protein
MGQGYPDSQHQIGLRPRTRKNQLTGTRSTKSAIAAGSGRMRPFRFDRGARELRPHQQTTAIGRPIVKSPAVRPAGKERVAAASSRFFSEIGFETFRNGSAANRHRRPRDAPGWTVVTRTRAGWVRCIERRLNSAIRRDIRTLQPTGQATSLGDFCFLGKSQVRGSGLSSTVPAGGRRVSVPFCVEARRRGYPERAAHRAV